MLPADPGDQLELAHRIANMAFVGKVQQLERENAALQQQALDRQIRPAGYCSPHRPTHFGPSSLESNGTL